MDTSLFIYTSHIFLFGPLLIYIGNNYGENIHNVLFNLLLIIGIGMMVYHSYLVYKKGVSSGFMYLLHVILFAPVLIYIGLMKKKSFWGAYSLLMIIGFAAIGYHLRLLYNKYK